MRVDVNQLSVRRGGRTVLDDVSFAVAEGRTLAVVGPNGAGKSTLLGAMLGLLPTTGGDVRFDGQSVHRLSRRRIAQAAAYVPQTYEGFLGFRVRDVIAAGRYAHVNPLDPLTNDDRVAVEKAIDRCDVRDLLGRTTDTLSGGERQKVWIAAAVAQASPVLLLDEPTNSLDPRHQAELIRLLRDLAAGGRTLIVVCHDLNLPAMLDAHVLALRAGRVAFDGSADEFLSPARLQEIFDTPFAWAREGPAGRPIVQIEV